MSAPPQAGHASIRPPTAVPPIGLPPLVMGHSSEEIEGMGSPLSQRPYMDRLLAMKCQVKTYAWGKTGSDSLVAELAAEGLDELEVQERTPYAELWMGTHPSGPSMIMLTSPWKMVTPLSEWIKLNPYLRGPRPRGSSGDVEAKITRTKSMLKLDASSLPFLFKILSVRTALSIQAHPDKILAARLHRESPDHYKDDNHKPEMAVAITPFEALCSFQPAYSILCNCRATPELVTVIGEKVVSDLDDAIEHRAVDDNAVKLALKGLFGNLMSAPAPLVAQQLTALIRRIESTNEILRAPVDVLAMRLYAQYEGDVGVFCVYLLNYLVLKPGEALYLGANEPHAYISGDCAEIMATSDNVVRAGLTPKWKDVSTLINMLTYVDGSPHIVKPTQPDGEAHIWRYSPPVDEFALDRVQMREGDQATLTSLKGLAILIVVKGSVLVEQIAGQRGDATPDSNLQSYLTAGAIHLVCPNTALRITVQHDDALVFRATARESS